jgi:hypothetical protein
MPKELELMPLNPAFSTRVTSFPANLLEPHALGVSCSGIIIFLNFFVEFAPKHFPF